MKNGKNGNGKVPKPVNPNNDEKIIVDEKDIIDEYSPESIKALAKKGFTHDKKGVITMMPKCPKCGTYLSQILFQGELRPITNKGEIETAEKREKREERVAVKPEPQLQKHFNFRWLILIPVLLISIFLYFYISIKHDRLPISVTLTNFREVSGYFTIEGSAENNLSPTEARPVAKFYDNFGRVVFTKKFPRQFFNTGITPIMLSVKNHKRVAEVEVWVEK
ncbi:MAG: hypothetical protein AB1393_09500 [Candidatus Edwardsbacteria bacterium]